ncbi:hypothetical protein ACQ4PT_024082 [Festuca glaucescens]
MSNGQLSTSSKRRPHPPTSLEPWSPSRLETAYRPAEVRLLRIGDLEPASAVHLLPHDSSSHPDLPTPPSRDPNRPRPRDVDAAAAVTSSPNPSLSPSGGDDSGEREKVAVAGHPLYERLLEADVACFRIATPSTRSPRIDAQIAARPPPLVAATEAVGTPKTSPPPPSSPPLPPTRSPFPPTPPSRRLHRVLTSIAPSSINQHMRGPSCSAPQSFYI